ncbi:MAG: hypothetical protein JXA33_08530 [Anaerolineae bacterium]|nr:hypothetical protein [Anaerolineae bacterium]
MMPAYKHASYGSESITLQNAHIRLDVHRRRTGWGWGEIFAADGTFVAVLDHLGEVLLRDQEIPMRMESQDMRHEYGSKGETLIFAVKSIIVKQKLQGTSFENWINYPLDQHILEGEVTLTLDPVRPVIYLSQRFVAKGNVYAHYVRGPWLKVGADGFGTAKDDAIFPGVEWLVGDEWSSGTDWFKDPWAKRWMPHPHKVTAPVMAISYHEHGIGLAWNPTQRATGWFNYRHQIPQPVFASPNFLDRQNNHLLGLMVPDVNVEAQENHIVAAPPLELHPEQMIQFDAEIFLYEGNSLDVLVDWVRRHGMPQPPEPRWSLPDALERIARAYTTHLWHENRGFGIPQKGVMSPHVPRFAERFLARYPDSPSAAALREKIAWCEQQPAFRLNRRELPVTETREKLLKQGYDLLSDQREDGSFLFDPDGRHYRKDDFVVAREFIEPMGLAGDTALDITILPALELLHIAQMLGDAEPDTGDFREAARKSLDFCLPMRRPEGGDFWETPLHAPNLLAAGHAANAYVLGYRAFGDERYLKKAVHWIRALLPFTHLWQPNQLSMLYNTKPCLCSSDWYFANWVRDHVQWEVLETFALSIDLGIDWADVDPEVDWHTYHKGITIAALRWMVDHTDAHWLPHNLPDTYEAYTQGAFDDCFADTHNSMTGNYGGMVILPDVIAYNLLELLKT